MYHVQYQVQLILQGTATTGSTSTVVVVLVHVQGTVPVPRVPGLGLSTRYRYLPYSILVPVVRVALARYLVQYEYMYPGFTRFMCFYNTVTLPVPGTRYQVQ